MTQKTSNLRIRLEPELHEQFLEICKVQDRPAAQVLREYMRSYVENHKQMLEPELPLDKTERN
ncbi:MAG: plasmid-related protein [Candidatus Thiodiazotropha sp.]